MELPKLVEDTDPAMTVLSTICATPANVCMSRAQKREGLWAESVCGLGEPVLCGRDFPLYLYVYRQFM